MDRTAIVDGLAQVFRDLFEDPALALTEATSAAELPAWDSLKHIDLVVAVEHRFGVKFTVREVAGVDTVGGFVTLIERRAG
jgi:acyl carrier protein